MSRRWALRRFAAVVGALAMPVHGTPRQRPALTGPNATGGYAHADWLVSVDALERELGKPSVKVVALMPESEFITGHLPGAARIDWTDLGLGDTTQASVVRWRAAVEQTLTRLGIDPPDTVVIYDAGTLFAARLWWVLDDLGHKDKRILNGGLPEWRAAGGKAEQGASTAQPTATPYRGTANPDDLATLDEVKASLGNAKVVLVDARSDEEYLRGHIPGAVHIDYRRNALPGSAGFWKPASALLRLYADAGATPNRTIIPYCSTGVRSAATYFSLRLIGYPKVRLYTGSWDEWSRHADLPMTKGSRP